MASVKAAGDYTGPARLTAAVKRVATVDWDLEGSRRVEPGAPRIVGT
jgi:hypothetical protein